MWNITVRSERCHRAKTPHLNKYKHFGHDKRFWSLYYCMQMQKGRSTKTRNTEKKNQISQMNGADKNPCDIIVNPICNRIQHKHTRTSHTLIEWTSKNYFELQLHTSSYLFRIFLSVVNLCTTQTYACCSYIWNWTTHKIHILICT